jgi:predicted nucleic acid-binding protein
MKRYLLDTSLVAAFLHGRKHIIELIDPWVRKQEVGTSILVYGEVIEYLKGLADYSRYQARLLRLFTLEQITPYPLTYPILERYADIRRTLRPVHQDIGDIDTLIAATALEEHLTLVTIDHDFERVPHLKVKLVNMKVA